MVYHPDRKIKPCNKCSVFRSTHLSVYICHFLKSRYFIGVIIPGIVATILSGLQWISSSNPIFYKNTPIS